MNAKSFYLGKNQASSRSQNMQRIPIISPTLKRKKIGTHISFFFKNQVKTNSEFSFCWQKLRIRRIIQVVKYVLSYLTVKLALYFSSPKFSNNQWYKDRNIKLLLSCLQAWRLERPKIQKMSYCSIIQPFNISWKARQH